jgi:hypothetical protein
VKSKRNVQLSAFVGLSFIHYLYISTHIYHYFGSVRVQVPAFVYRNKLGNVHIALDSFSLNYLENSETYGKVHLR